MGTTNSEGGNQAGDHIPPLVVRQLRAQMALKNLSVNDVAKTSGVPYTTTSDLLTGRLNHSGFLERIQRAVAQAPDLPPA
jgi:predicted transcriptional regulator of viral defense system